MIAARRMGKWTMWGLAGVGATVLLLRVGVGLYVGSASGRTAVAERLGGMIGLPVEVADVSLGMRSSAIRFRVLDPKVDPASQDAEVLVVDSAEADISLASIVTGRASPRNLHIRGAALTLRIDENGKILTTMPQSPAETAEGPVKIPAITLDGARVTVRQTGRPEFTLGGINLRVEPTGETVALRGDVDDPGWGKWAISGEANASAKSGSVDITADDATLSTDRLRSAPFVPPAVWDNARPEGRARVEGHFRYAPETKFAYDVRLQPKSASLGLPSAGVTLTELTAIVHAHDGVVEVGGTGPKSPASAKLAGGAVTASARWDFSKDPAVADPITVTAERLAVKQLPAKWGLRDLGGELPGKLSLEDGFLSGSALIKVVAHADGRVETYGGGAGEIELASFLGGSGKIAVTLGGDGQKLEFNLGGQQPPPKTPIMLAPPHDDASTLRVNVTSEQELAALLALLALQPPEPKRTDQSNLEATITLRDIDVAQFIEQLQLKVPYAIAGKVSVQAKFGVPLGNVATRSSYRFTGTLTSPELRFEGLTVRDITTEVNYQNGKLTLSTLKGRIPHGPGAKEAGEFSGAATAQIDPPGDATANLTLDRIPLASVAAAMPGLKLDLRGLVSGKAEFKAPFDKLADPTTWNAWANVTSDEVSVAGRTAKAIALSVSLAKGTATLTQATATIEGIPLTGSGTLGLTGKLPFTASLKTTGTSLADFRKLVPEADLPPVEGVLTTDSSATGTLAPLAFSASGRITADKLTLAKTQANHIDVKWELTQDRVKLTDLTADAFGGRVTGSLDYPFAADKAGDFHLSFKDLDTAAAAAFVPDFPVKITGAVSGKVSGAIPAAKDGNSRIGNIDLDLTAPRLMVQNVPTERLVGKAVVKNGVLEYSLDGKALGGSFEIKGRYPGDAKKDAAPKGGRGSLHIADLDLARLSPDLRVRSLAPLRGRVDVRFDFDNNLSAGSGRIEIRGFGWGDADVAQDLGGVVLLRDKLVEVRELSGAIAGGTLRARARVRLDEPGRNFLVVSIDRADAARLLAPLPDFKGVVTGAVSLTLRGTFGRTMRGSGELGLARGTLGGVAVSELRVPFDFSTAPGVAGRLVIREATTLAGSGRVAGNLTLDWGAGSTASITGAVRFVDVPVAALSAGLGENALLGAGRLTGRFDLAGTNVRSADDIRGSLTARLNNTSVKEVPLLRQAVPYLNPIGATKPFQSGDVKGTLTGGVFRLHRLALANPSAQLFASGTIRTTGLLDLDVVAHTGQIGPTVGPFRAFGLRLPAFGPIPIALIRDVSTFLSNRTVRLTITGTASNPVVRVNAGALLAEEAVRFFVTRYILPADAAEALGIGTATGVLGNTTSR